MKKQLKRIASAMIAISLLLCALPSFGEDTPETALEARALPAAFDLRDVDGKCYVTPVRSQAPFGTCWSFATVAALESSILGAGLKGADGNAAKPETLNLSEKQLAWFSARPLKEADNPQNGEGQLIADFITKEGLVEFMNRGGNGMYSICALSSGIGPEHESANPYYEYHGSDATVEYSWIGDKLQRYSYSVIDDWIIPDEYRSSYSYTLREARRLPDPAGHDAKGYYVYNEDATLAIKQELYELRAVQIAFCADTSLPGQESEAQYLSENWAHYTYLPQGASHAVTIVGWDDNYPKENFLSGTIEAGLDDGSIKHVDKAPPANGAWLVKNSWGSGNCDFPDSGTAGWGIEDENGVHTGYFWLSYYDQTLCSAVSYIVEEADKGSKIAQYDYLPVSEPLTKLSDTEVSMANRFMPEHSLILDEVSCMTALPELEVTYEIYLLDAYASNPTQGLKVAQKTVDYVYAGFHKENLSTFELFADLSGDGSGTLMIPKYQPYSVVVTQKTADGKYVFTLMSNSGGQSGSDAYTGIVNMSESWLYTEESWADYSDVDKEELLSELIDDEFLLDDEHSFDNFPIKAYYHEAENDCVLEVRGSMYLYYKTERHSCSTLKLSIHAKDGTVPYLSADDISWGMDEHGSTYVVYEPGSNPFESRITANDFDGAQFTMYATVKGIGTVSFTVHLHKIYMVGLIFPRDPVTYETINRFAYTGDEIRPEVGTENELERLIEGRDYVLTYENNIKCGLAGITATGLGEVVPTDNAVSENFVIVPQKAEITGVSFADGALRIKLKDQSESGLSGYRVQYRPQGEESWSEVTVNAPGTEAMILNIAEGKAYEVRAAGFITLPEDAEWYAELTNYGESSEILTVDLARSAEAENVDTELTEAEEPADTDMAEAENAA